jgi:putative spermidine/putrescine transport system ATP-binding protein
MSAAAIDHVVEFERVAKTFDGRSRVVDDLNLSILRGEFLSLLGPSGSGKTTTLMMLAGFEIPTAGEIYVVFWTPEIVDGHDHPRGKDLVFQRVLVVA